jgi:ArsR family transcriptional regulator
MMAELAKMLAACGLDVKSYSKYFKAFGDPSRQKILVLLSSGEKTVQDIADAVGLAQPTTSRHLAVLKEAGAVTDRRDGQKVYYGLDRNAIRLCCSGFCGCLGVEEQAGGRKKRKKTDDR